MLSLDRNLVPKLHGGNTNLIGASSRSCAAMLEID